MESTHGLENPDSLKQYMKDRKNPNTLISIPTLRSLLGRIDFLSRNPSILSPRRILYFLATVDAFLRERATALMTILTQTVALGTAFDDVRQLSALRSSLVFLRTCLGKLHRLVTESKQRLMHWSSVIIVLKARNFDGKEFDEQSLPEQGNTGRTYSPFVVTCNLQQS